MSKKQNEYLIDTDVLEGHLLHNKKEDESYLEKLLQRGICFSTVLNASELLYKAATEIEQRIVLDVLSGLKILGLHSRYSLLVPKYSAHTQNYSEALFCVVADYNKLPIVTLNKYRYRKISLATFHPDEIIFANKLH